MPIRLIAILPMLLLVAALIATACESAPPDDATQDSAIAAAAPTTTPTATPTTTVTPTPQHTQTLQCQPGLHKSPSAQVRACAQLPNPMQCSPDRMPPAPKFRDDGSIIIFECHPDWTLTPTPRSRYPKLDERLNQVVDALESGASILNAASLAESSSDGLVVVIIEMDRDPKELVIWLHNNGAEFGFVNSTFLADEGWARRNETTIEAEYGIILLNEYLIGEAELEPPYEGGRTSILAEVPVSLLVRLSQQAGVIRIGQDAPIIPQQTDVPPAPQEPQDTVTQTPTPRATSQGLSAHGVPSWHQAGFKGSGVKV